VKEHRYAEVAARLLRAARGRLGPHPSTPPGDAVALLAGVIRSSAARRRHRRIAKSIGAVAGVVCLALTLGWTLTRSKQPASAVSAGPTADPVASPRPAFVASGTAVATVMAMGGPAQPLLPGQAWHSGEHLRTEGQAVVLATRDDSAIEVEPHSDLQLVRADAERWLRLGSGAVEVHVAKLKAAERFVIATPDAEVEVRGTRFRVAVVSAVDDCGQGTVTRVSVTEGVVVVRSSGRESRVEAGRRWPTGCAEGRVSIAPRPAGDPREDPKKQVVPRAAAARAVAPADVSVSTLATENDLFGAALKAEGAGDKREAVQLLDVLLARFPASPLRESAAVERARLAGSIQPRP
jgi:ferric-dicitrate binding protein FerR (iron transport regulator)